MPTQTENNRNPKYSYVFQELTKDDNDEHNLVSYIAYILYKERKIEFISSKNGNPSPEEIKTFNDIYLMPAQLDGLRNEAESILTEILNVTYGEKLKEVEIRLEASLPSEMKKEYLQLQTQIRTNQGQLQTELSTLNKRGWGYWLTEVGKGTLITIVSTLIIWNLAAAFVGKEVLSKMDAIFTPNSQNNTSPNTNINSSKSSGSNDANQ